MALSEAQIYDIATDWFVDGWAVARAIKMVEQVEYKVRKQDDALILQLVEAFEYVRNTPTYQYDAKTGHRLAKEALQAGRARLEGTPCD